MNRFNDKVVLITGSAEGMGREFALAFAREGATVIPTDINMELLAKTAKEIADLTGQPVQLYKMDVTNKKEVNQVIKEVIDQHGRIDILIPNAGVSTVNPVINLTEEEWDFCFDVNSKGVFLVCQAALPYMIAAQNGKIVITASAASKMGSPLQAHYNASKFAVLGFTQSLAKEVAQYHINVNAVCPGAIKTSMQDREVVWYGQFQGSDPEKIREMMAQYAPLGRLGYPEDVAKVVLFLASSDADFMTGQGINVTGGIIMH